MDGTKIELPTPISTDGPPVDVPLLRKAVEWAEAEAAKPEAESEWYQPKFVIVGTAIGRSCGTAYCIAGHIVAAIDGPEVCKSLPFGWAMRASGHLGLSYSEASALFDADNTITDVRHVAERIAARAGQRL